MESSTQRMATYSNWPTGSVVNAADLVAAGLYYTGNGDRVKCAFCGGVLLNWQHGDRPLDEHARIFPRCQFVQKTLSIKPVFQRSCPEARNIIKHTVFAATAVRVASFCTWPVTADQSAEALAAAGFFYQGSEDNVTCFWCGGSLRNWERGDDAWEEHARWFPRCEYVRHNKGVGFIRSVQQKHTQPVQRYTGETMAVQSNCVAATEQAGSIPTTGVAGHLSSHPTWSGVNGLHKASTVGSSAGRVTDTRCSVETAASVQPPRQPHVQPPRQPHSTLAAAAIQMGVTDTRCSVETAASVQPPRQTHSTLAAAAIQMGVTDTRCSVETAASVQSPRQPHSTLAAAAIQMGFNQQLVTKAIEDKRTSSGDKFSDVQELVDALLNEDRYKATTQEDVKTEQDADSQLTCKLCMDAEVTQAFLPCGHLVCCTDCVRGVSLCPICRAHIQDTVRIFFP